MYNVKKTGLASAVLLAVSLGLTAIIPVDAMPTPFGFWIFIAAVASGFMSAILGIAAIIAWVEK